MAVLVERRRNCTHWHNPETGKAEDVRGLSSDERTLEMLRGHPDSDRLVERYVVLREEGLGVGQAFLSVGRRLRMFRPGHLDPGWVREPQRRP